MMENLTITLRGAGIQDTQSLNIQVSVEAVINISAKAAQRKATTWLVSEVGNMLIGGTPQLVIGKTTSWRIPVLLTSTISGTLGQVGHIDIDAESGNLLADTEYREHILSEVQHFSRTPLPTAG
jgi:hypothetical protein